MEGIHEPPTSGCRAEKGEFLTRLFSPSHYRIGEGARSQIAVGFCGRMAPPAPTDCCRVGSYERSGVRLPRLALRTVDGTAPGILLTRGWKAGNPGTDPFHRAQGDHTQA